MFSYTDFNGNISDWDVSKVENIESMFYITKFDGDLSNWKLRKDVINYDIFKKSPIESKKEFWPKALQ
jgi:hypothetical protein